jgi:hypothetical protein
MALDGIRLTGTTDASGDLTLTAERAVLGLLWSVEWIDGDLADGVDAVLSLVNTSSEVDLTLLTLTNANDDAQYFPRATECNEAGVAQSNRVPPLMDGTLQLVISSGGNAKTGGCIVYYLD